MQVEEWISILILHLVRCPATIDLAKDRVTAADIAEVYGTTKASFWTFSLEYYLEHRRVIPKYALELKVSEYCGSLSDGVGSLTLEDMRDFLEWMFSIDEADFNPGDACKYIKTLLSHTRVSSKLRNALESGMDASDLENMVKSGNAEAAVGVVDVLDPLADIDNLVGTFPPCPVGGAEVAYFNKLFQGGIRPGEVAVLLGPMGGFKTTLALDVVCAMAKMHEHSLFCAYEQSFKTGDLMIRFVARLANIPKTRVESVKIEHMTPEEQQRILDAKKVSKYAMVWDRSTYIDKISDIAEIVRSLDKQGRKPQILFIDQLMTWINKWGWKDDAIRVGMREIILGLKHDVAEKLGVSVIILHQLTAALAGGSSTRKPTHTDSQECKSVGNWPDFVVMLGNLNKETGVMWGVAGKTRRGVPTALLLRPNGSLCHITEASDMSLTPDGSSFAQVGAHNAIQPAMQGYDDSPAGASELGEI